MVDHYTKQSSYRGTPEYDPWCSKFVTTVMNSVLGISANHATKSENRRGAWGGSQIVNGYENFWNYDEDKGGKLEGQQKVGQSNIWKKINKQVSGKTSKKDKVKLLKEFFNKNIYPQPGDIMIVDPSGNNSFKESAKNGFDSSHTAMIEKVLLTNEDALIYTIEGNSGQKVTGRKYNLTKTTGKFSLGWIVNIARMSIDNYGRSSHISKQVDIKSSQYSEISEEVLLNPLIEMNSILQSIAFKKSYVSSDENNSTTFKLSNSNENASTS